MNIKAQENINLLIVDDDVDHAAALNASLEQDGLNILTVNSPKKAVEMCIENDISIALIDIHMPELNGFELLDLLKKNPLTAHIIVVLMTGYDTDSGHVINGLDTGAVDYLFKPIDTCVLNAKVRSLIILVNYQREINKKNRELEDKQAELFSAIEKIEQSRVIKENFLANMSHEIRTPLNAIVGLTSLFGETQLTKEQQKMVELMEYSSQSLLGIVNDVLESAQIDAGKIVIKRAKINVVDLVETICDLNRPVANKKGLKLVCEIGEGVTAMIMADQLRLNQILLNLITNAIKFTQTGAITIKLRQLKKTNDDVLLEFTVKDTGVGIPKSSIDKIFNRFEQIEDKNWQKFGGTGLGLSIVKRLIELKGGRLKVESTVGEGTSFIFTNTYEEVAEFDTVNAPHKLISELPKFDNLLVLLAEDNAINRFIAVKMLAIWNVKVDVALNGLKAFKMLKKNNYDLILMDTHMPVMDGIDATRKIRAELTGSKKDIPIISFSASVLDREKNEALNAGADDFIRKPFEPQILNSIIHVLVDAKKPAAAIAGN